MQMCVCVCFMGMVFTVFIFAAFMVHIVFVQILWSDPDGQKPATFTGVAI